MTTSLAERMRDRMPICKHFAYFDHAAVAPLPAESAKEIEKFARQASQHGDTCWPEWSQKVELLRGELAKMLNAKASEIAFIPNTSSGIGLVAEGWRWSRGDSLVVPANEFPSNLAPWRNLARKGVEVREVPVSACGEVGLEAILNAIDSSTKLVAVSWVGFASGWRIDVGRFCEAIHARGPVVFLDAIQGLGAFPIDVEETRVDFLAADGHKWMLGPEGAGVLYVAERNLGLLDPLMVGWHSLDGRAAFDPAVTGLKSTAARYEGGSANIVGLLALAQSVRLLMEHGAHVQGSGFAESILQNVAWIESELRSIGCDVLLPKSQNNRSGILGIQWPGANLAAARTYSLSHGIVTSVRAGRLRVSAHAYNNRTDISRLVDTLQQFMREQP